MAEARCGQDQSMRDSRDSGGGRRHSRGPNASAERNKPEQPSSSQGALSSIRAAIMRTSRSTSQEQHRERRSHRRPQITILSAEPMAPSWYPAAPPPSAVQVPPPSYEQVLREKSREQQQHPHPHLFASSSSTPPPPAPSPAAPPPPFSSVPPSPAPPPPAPSRSTIATQTDAPPLPPPPAMTNTTPQTTSAERPATRPSLRRPPRPPKPACPPRPDGDALIRAPTPTPTPTPIPTQTPTHMLTHTPMSTQTDQPPEKEEEAESAAAATARPRPRPRSRAGLRPISQEVTSSLPISSLGSIPKSQSMSSEIVVAQPISGGGGGGESKLASRPVSSERTGNGAGEDQSDGVCLGAEGVCAGGSQYLQDLLDVFGPDSSAHGHALSHANTGSHLVEEEEEEDEEGGKEVAMTMAVALPPVPVVEVGVGVEERGAMGGTSPRPVPRPRSRQTETLTPPPPSVSGSPSPPQPQPRRRSLSTSSNTSQTSSQALEGPTAPKPGLPPRLLPLRPPPIKPAKPPHLIGPCPTTTANQEQGQRLPKRGPPLPPRPKPGHALYKNSQKEDFDLLDLSDTLDDLNTHTDIQACASAHPDIPADVKHAITDTPLMTNASVNTSTHTHMDTQMWTDTQSGTTEGRWDPEGTPPKSLSAQQPESIILSEGKHTTPVMTCVAIFAFRGEARDELSFCEGDVITLTGYVNEEWGRGRLKGHAGIFPLCFTSSPQPQELRKVDANMK